MPGLGRRGAGAVMELAGVVLALAAASVGCQGRSKGGAATDGGADAGRILFQFGTNRDLDLLFVVDDSPGMAPVQAKFRARLPEFMNLLGDLPGGLPNLHVAVVSSSLGSGIFGNVAGCQPGTAGNLNGSFQHAAACTALPADQPFVKSIAGVNNFTGDIADVLTCITNLGASGCGFEHQFESTRLALQRALNSDDRDNGGGFLRPNALLAIVMVTNEDDCSVDADSMLFDPSQQRLANPLGGLQSYRCSEFGHRCDQPMPHDVAGLPMTLSNCRSAEDGKLVTVDGFVTFLRSLKPDATGQIVVAAIAGPVVPYVVGSHAFSLQSGGMEIQPWIEHSCTQAVAMGAEPEAADPGIRIKQWVDAFGASAVMLDVCASDFHDSLARIAQLIGRSLGLANCLADEEWSTLVSHGDGAPSCQAVVHGRNAAGRASDITLPFCFPGRSILPCWELGTPAESSLLCPSGRLFQVCRDRDCAATGPPTVDGIVELVCEFAP